MLVRSDYVGNLTASGLEAVGAYGITTVLDLRSEGEVRDKPNPFASGAGPTYLSVPLVDDPTMQRLGDAPEMLDRYLMMIENRGKAFCAIFNAIAETEGGVVFHCFAGKDRTGLVSAMLLAMAGVSRDAIASDFAQTDVQLATKYQQWITDTAPDRRDAMRNDLRCPPDRILGVLTFLDQKWGGVEGYLEASGMTAGTIERVGEKLV